VSYDKTKLYLQTRPKMSDLGLLKSVETYLNIPSPMATPNLK